MQWKKINNTANIWNFELMSELEGTYVGVKENVGENNSRLYYIKKIDGEEVAFWGSALLDDLMRSVSVNACLRIRYLGKEKSNKTNREYKNYEIELGEEE